MLKRSFSLMSYSDKLLGNTSALKHPEKSLAAEAVIYNRQEWKVKHLLKVTEYFNSVPYSQCYSQPHWVVIV